MDLYNALYKTAQRRVNALGRERRYDEVRRNSRENGAFVGDPHGLLASPPTAGAPASNEYSHSHGT